LGAVLFGAVLEVLPRCCRCVMLQEEDVIGVLPSGDKISNMKPLGDRVLIKVRPAAAFSFSGCG
jgi:hypothetical protein